VLDASEPWEKDTERGGDKDRGQDERESEVDVVRKRKSMQSKARPPASEPPKFQKIMTNDAAVGGSVMPGGILMRKGAGGRASDKVARWPYTRCECGDVHHFKFKCRRAGVYTLYYTRSLLPIY
jgi:hypothetical protein